jgi:pimeloyl-ACP methyl ester carboxylesterase
VASRTVAVRDGFEVDLLDEGAGPPLLYLHGTFGRREEELIGRLARSHRVLAPCHPGYGGTTGAERLSDLHDLIYYYLDLLDELALRDLALVGHGLGGMFAAELAAVQPERLTGLVLIGPLGLWNPAHPVLDFFAAEPERLAAALYHDPSSPAARATATVPPDDNGYVAYTLDRASAMAAAARYLWPIPNRGLAKRLHRVRTPTLLLWGESDGLCPVEYGREFQAAIAGAELAVLPAAGHMVTVEQPAELARLIERFLAAPPANVRPAGRGA